MLINGATPMMMRVVATVALLAAAVAAGCVRGPIAGSCPAPSSFDGSCGAFGKPSICWHESICCADTASDCCVGDPGPIVGLVAGILIAIGACIFCCYMSPNCCNGASRYGGSLL
jgi:hypothetical protein